MKRYRLALIGFGNVGQGFAQILHDRGAEFARLYGAEFKIVAVSDLLKGSVYQPDGLDTAVLLNAIQTDGNLNHVPAATRGWDGMETIQNSNADVVVEMSYTDLNTGEPAIHYTRAALELGKHVVTTNKGPIALAYPELAAIAKQNGVEFGAEGTVMSGTPALRVGQELLASAGIWRVQGIFNGTTNYILTQMESGTSYADALADAQERGYAEADPTGDVEGHDAAGKVVILANLLMGASLKMADVKRQGITQISAADIAAAQENGKCWKLIGRIEIVGDQIEASVQPTRIPLSDPLAAVGGATNAITYATDLLGDVTLVGPGAGRVETGYALIGDLLAIHRKN
ncbi:MAG: homoserine dehydrogenase [Chloroflexi bacterium]|nr:homoserine dehydrogenase [Chloroflexota bacterium]